MKNLPPSNGQAQSPALSPAASAEYSRKALLEAANVLKGAAIQMDAGGKARMDLLISAGHTLANAFVRGLIAPQDFGECDAADANRMIEQLRAWLIGSKVEESEVVYIPGERQQSHPTQVDLNELTWSWQTQKPRLEEIERTLLRDGDPAGREGEAHQRFAIDILRAAWETLSATHPDLLSPEIALIKNELLPGIDPWFDLARDFRKAAWVCEIAANLIKERCDLRIIDAARETGIPPGTISRACSKRHIKTNGKKGGELRMNRPSFASWEIKHRELVTKRGKQIRAGYPRTRRYMCDHCGKFVETDKKPCPYCNMSHISELKLYRSLR